MSGSTWEMERLSREEAPGVENQDNSLEESGSNVFVSRIVPRRTNLAGVA